MDAGLGWTAAGSAAGVLGVVLIAWQIRLQVAERHRAERSRVDAGGSSASGVGGLPVAVPLGRLPGEVRGRDVLLGELRRRLRRRPRGSGGAWVLAGMGGLGKSTVALVAGQAARAAGWRVWWVTATDSASLAGGMVEVLCQLGAPEEVVRPVRDGVPAAAGRAWEFLNGPHLAGRRWLLIFDNADVPAVLAAHGASSPADHAGWLRSDPSGMVIVTSRVRDARVWGPQVALRVLEPLDDAIAGRVLADLAPGIADPGGEQARELGHRLGGLPLALHLAGSYLASPFARWHTFAGYREALDSARSAAALADLDDDGIQIRATVQRTWDLSLDALAADGRPQARPLLYLLSCYAPATAIPMMLLQAGPLARLLTLASQWAAEPDADADARLERLLRDGLASLAMVGLIDIAGDDGTGARAVTVHPVVADVNRGRLRAAGRADLPVIGHAAVGLLEAACGGIDAERPRDWPAWLALVPHISAMLGWLASELDLETLARLVHLSAPAAAALRCSGTPAAAEILARSTVAAAGRLSGAHPATLTARYRLLQAIGEQGRNSEAEQLGHELLADQQHVLGQDHPDTMATRHGLAWMIEYQGRYAEAEQICRELLADQQHVLGQDHPDTLSTRNIIARLTGLQGRYAEAEQLCRQVLADRQRVLGDEHPDTLVTRHNLAWMIGLEGRYGEAERMLRDLLGQRQRILGEHHPAVLTTRRRLARVITTQGRHAEAELILRQLLGDLQQIQGARHPATLTARTVLAEAVGLQGRASEAERLCREEITDWQRIGGSGQPRALQAVHTLAWMILLQGRYAEAEEQLRQVLASQQRILGDAHPDTDSTRLLLAQSIASQGQSHEATALLRQIITNHERVGGGHYPDAMRARDQLAQMTAKQDSISGGRDAPRLK